MADPHSTAERAAWVTARAGRRPAAQRRGQRLTARARRIARYDAGAGDAAASEVAIRGRVARRAIEHDEHRVRWTVWAGIVEATRIAVAGPGIAIAWAVYGAWYQQVPDWGPIRWRVLAVVSAIMAVLMVVVGAVVWLGSGIPWWAWWLLAQPVIGTARAGWLAHAYGWDAVPATASPGRAPTLSPIRVRLGDQPPLPTTEPTEPVATTHIQTVRVSVPRSNSQEEK